MFNLETLKQRLVPNCMDSIVTPPKLALTNPVESLTIPPVEPTSGQTGNRHCKNLLE
jgi:hypothetical protein